MSKRILFKLSVVMVVLLAGIMAVPVLAAPPLNVNIEVDETIVPNDGETFYATGAAVDEGLICATGTVDEVGDTEISGPPGGSLRILRVIKRFDCGSGNTFDVNLVVRLDIVTGYTTARWNVIGGAGDFAGLHGSGSLAGTPIVVGESITDEYDGRLH